MLNRFQLLEKCGIRFVFAAVGKEPTFTLHFHLRIILGLCKKSLEITNMSEHDGDLYCRQCYSRKYGIRGVGFGIGAGALGMDTGERYGNTQSLSYVGSFYIERKIFFSVYLEIKQIIPRFPVLIHQIKSVGHAFIKTFDKDFFLFYFNKLKMNFIYANKRNRIRS